MYILILMVVAFVFSWLPLSIVNILRDFGIRMGFIDDQLYFSQLFIHSIAMTSVIWNPILYFWMSKTHRRKIKRDIIAAAKARRTSCNPDGYSRLSTSKLSPENRRSLALSTMLKTTTGTTRQTCLEMSLIKKKPLVEPPTRHGMSNGLTFHRDRAYSNSCQASLMASPLPSVAEIQTGDDGFGSFEMIDGEEDVEL